MSEETKQNRELRQLKSSEIPKIRNQILTEQNGCCALCHKPITDETGVSLDHQHKFMKETLGEDGAGLVRGVLCRACNVVEGKIWNNMGRYLQPDGVQGRIEFLQELVRYYEKENYDMIHPSEAESEPKLMKSSYNKLRRVYDKKARFPEYPKSKKMTKKLTELFNEYGIQPDFYH